MLAPNAVMAAGDEQQQYTVDFEEAGSASPAMELLMKVRVPHALSVALHAVAPNAPTLTSIAIHIRT